MNRPDIGPCEFHQAYSITISPDGHLYKCPAFSGIKHLSAGHVSEFEFNEIGKKQIQFLKWDEHCESCSYLPNCVGGCRYNALNKTGSLENKSCEIAYLKQSTDRFMRQEIESLMNSA